MGPDQLGAADWLIISAAAIAALLVGLCLDGFIRGFSDGRKVAHRNAGRRRVR